MWSNPPYTITLFLCKDNQSVNSVNNQPHFALVTCYIVGNSISYRTGVPFKIVLYPNSLIY